MTSRAIRFVAPLFAAALTACGGPQPTQPTAPAPAATDDTSHAMANPAPAGPAGAAGAAPARVTTRGPNVTPDGVVFNFKPERKPTQIFLAGNFNDWKPSDPKFLMKDDDGDGMWSITVKLPPGTYQYKYVADGQWIQDQAAPGSAPDGFGGRNSQFDVK
jgi:hypothetical protein